MRHAEFYELTEVSSAHSLKFLFISKGKRDIIKAVEYTHYQNFRGQSVYNLGFGDYDFSLDILSDDSNTNNGDVYQVFNTVLNTIPLFFQHSRRVC